MTQSRRTTSSSQPWARDIATLDFVLYRLHLSWCRFQRQQLSLKLCQTKKQQEATKQMNCPNPVFRCVWKSKIKRCYSTPHLCLTTQRESYKVKVPQPRPSHKQSVPYFILHWIKVVIKYFPLFQENAKKRFIFCQLCKGKSSPFENMHYLFYAMPLNTCGVISLVQQQMKAECKHASVNTFVYFARRGNQAGCKCWRWRR